MFDPLSAKTAILRGKMSSPTKWLWEEKKIVGRTLDYGCGRGDDIKEIAAYGYDPFYQPQMPTGSFDTIICQYVLNVVNQDCREFIAIDMLTYLEQHGEIYITVRTDLKKTVRKKGKPTQYFVKLNLPVIKKTAGWTMYQLNHTIAGDLMRRKGHAWLQQEEITPGNRPAPSDAFTVPHPRKATKRKKKSAEGTSSARPSKGNPGTHKRKQARSRSVRGSGRKKSDG